MRLLTCSMVLAAAAALTGCQSGSSHSHECCAQERLYPYGTAYPTQGPAGPTPQAYPTTMGYAAGSAAVPQPPAYPTVPPQYRSGR